MRFKDIIAESIDVEPGIKRPDGVISWPEHASRREMSPCECCDGNGRDVQWEYHPRRKTEPDFVEPCECCDGKGKRLKWVYDYPRMNLSNYHVEAVIAPLLGVEFDYTQFFPPETLPDLRRRLIRIKNGDPDAFSQPPSDEQAVVVDRSGDVPKIGRGARMIGSGVSEHQILMIVDRLLEIIDWAQRNNCGLRWA